MRDINCGVLITFQAISFMLNIILYQYDTRYACATNSAVGL